MRYHSYMYQICNKTGIKTVIISGVDIGIITDIHTRIIAGINDGNCPFIDSCKLQLSIRGLNKRSKRIYALFSDLMITFTLLINTILSSHCNIVHLAY